MVHRGKAKKNPGNVKLWESPGKAGGLPKGNYLYDVPGGASRGGHAHKALQQLIVSVMGAFDVILDDGYEQKRIHLDRAYYRLYIPVMIWRELENLSSGGICLVLASAPYDEKDYIRDYEEYLQLVQAGANGAKER